MVEAKDDSPLLRLYCLNRTEGKGTVPPWEEAAPSNDDRVGVVCVPLVADVVEPTDLRAVDCHDPVALGGGEQATELRLPPQALLGTLIADSLVHGEKRSPLPHSARCTTGVGHVDRVELVSAPTMLNGWSLCWPVGCANSVLPAISSRSFHAARRGSY